MIHFQQGIVKVCDAKQSGGKAGDGKAKTSTIQVFEGNIKVKQYVYKLRDIVSKKSAIAKAVNYVNNTISGI